MRLYYHKTDGGAEYLMDALIECDNGHKEGVFEGAKYIVRIDGDITKDAEINVRECEHVFDLGPHSVECRKCGVTGKIRE